MSQFGDFLNDISYGKKFILNENNASAYQPYVINNMFSRYPDSIFHAHEMNMLPNLSKSAHYTYLMNALRPRKRFSQMKKPRKHMYFNEIQDYYGYSDEKTEEVLRILTDEQIEYIVNLKGGVRK